MKEYIEQLVKAGVLIKSVTVSLDITEYYVAGGYELEYFYDGERIVDHFEESHGEFFLIVNDGDYDDLSLDDVNPADITIIKKTVVTLNELLGE